jgi:hypothetical protein
MRWLDKHLYLGVFSFNCAYKLHSLCEDCLVSLHLLLCLSLWENPEVSFFSVVVMQPAPAMNCKHAVPYIIRLMLFPAD